MEKRSAQRIEILLEILLLPNEKEERGEKMETVLRDGTFCLEKKL